MTPQYENATSGEREALITDLRELIDLHTWAKDVTERAAAMLAADAPKVQPLVRPRELADNAEWLADKIMGNDYIQEAAMLLRKMAPIVRAADAQRPQLNLDREPAQQVAVPQGWTRGKYSYQLLFNAIASATTREANGIGVSVVKFEDYMLAAAHQPPQADARVPMTEREIADAYLEATNQHLRPGDVRLVTLVVRAVEARYGIGVKP